MKARGAASSSLLYHDRRLWACTGPRDSGVCFSSNDVAQSRPALWRYNRDVRRSAFEECYASTSFGNLKRRPRSFDRNHHMQPAGRRRSRLQWQYRQWAPALALPVVDHDANHGAIAEPVIVLPRRRHFRKLRQRRIHVIPGLCACRIDIHARHEHTWVI